MQLLVFLLSSISIITIAHPNIYHDCTTRLFNPLNYLDQLPSLSLPYVNNIPIPNIPPGLIKPTPVVTTKVINVVTKYIERNPVCIKATGKKKPACKHRNAPNQKNYANEHLITKEYFINRQAKQSKMEEDHLKKIKLEVDAYKNLLKIGSRKDNKSSMLPMAIRPAGTIDRAMAIESSEPLADIVRHRTARNVGGETHETPKLLSMDAKLKDLLIEDRLDRLEDVLPHYTRMRVYQTSTITVTRTRTNRMATATLMVKNCVPDGIDYCKKQAKSKKKKKKRKSKVALEQIHTIPNYNSYYYG